MTKIHILIILAISFLWSIANACQDNEVSIHASDIINGHRTFYACENGEMGDPTATKWVEFFQKAHARNPQQTNRWVDVLSEGEFKGEKAATNFIERLTNWEDPNSGYSITNQLYDGTIDAGQGLALLEMEETWKQVMEVTPQKKVNLFDPKIFNEIGAANTKAIEELGMTGSICQTGAKPLQGFQAIMKTDGYNLNIIPLAMESLGSNRYKIRYHEKNVMFPMSPVLERTIHVDPATGKIDFTNREGKIEEIESGSLAVKSTRNLFFLGAENALCNAEAEVEAVKGKAESNAAPKSQN